EGGTAAVGTGGGGGGAGGRGARYGHAMRTATLIRKNSASRLKSTPEVSTSGHRIVAARPERLATQQPAGDEQAAVDGAVALHALQRVVGTTREETARRWQVRRHDHLIRPHQGD